MEVFVDVWEAQVDELGRVLRLITAGGDPSKRSPGSRHKRSAYSAIYATL